LVFGDELLPPAIKGISGVINNCSVRSSFMPHTSSRRLSFMTVHYTKEAFNTAVLACLRCKTYEFSLSFKHNL
jgi:hypothetical protein